jgi:DNA-binding GntR family transcriptional regulator
MVDTTGPSVEDQEVEIAALTFECRLAVEAAVVRTRQLNRMPASPALKAELDRVIGIMEQMADAFQDLHGAITRLIGPGNRAAPVDLPAASHRDIEEIGAAILRAGRPLGGYIEEAQLARNLGKEHRVVRDAAIWLEGRGLVKRMGDLGVRPNGFTQTDLRELLEVWEVFEPIACGLAASAMTEEEIDCLRNGLCARAAGEARFMKATGHLHHDFHIQVILGSKNSSLIELLCDNLHYKLRFYRDSFRLDPAWHDKALEERRAVVEALADGDPIAASAAMREHLATTRACIIWADAEGQSCKVEDLASYRLARQRLQQ